MRYQIKEIFYNTGNYLYCSQTYSGNRTKDCPMRNGCRRTRQRRSNTLALGRHVAGPANLTITQSGVGTDFGRISNTDQHNRADWQTFGADQQTFGTNRDSTPLLRPRPFEALMMSSFPKRPIYEKRSPFRLPRTSVVSTRGHALSSESISIRAETG